MSKSVPPKNSPSFEQSIARLEEIIARIDHPETGLEETISLTAEGHELIRNCRKLLEQAELKIQALSDTGENNTPETPRPASTAKSNTSPTQKTASPSPDDHGFSLF